MCEKIDDTLCMNCHKSIINIPSVLFTYETKPHSRYTCVDCAAKVNMFNITTLIYCYKLTPDRFIYYDKIKIIEPDLKFDINTHKLAEKIKEFINTTSNCQQVTLNDDKFYLCNILIQMVNRPIIHSIISIEYARNISQTITDIILINKEFNKIEEYLK